MLNALKSINRSVFRLTTFGLSKNVHVTRYFAYRHLSKYKIAICEKWKALSVSGSEVLAKTLGFKEKQIVSANYPQHDLLNLDFPDDCFDAIISDQVLEHIAGPPQQAINESFRVVRNGGYVLHTTCFISPLHECPRDYWRFSPEALTILVGNEHKIITVGGWGNLYAMVYMGLGLTNELIPENRFHPANWIATYNQKRFPIYTWVLAQCVK